MVAIRKSDIKGNYLHISRQEVVDYKAADSGSMKYNGTKVVEYTKTDAGLRKKKA